MDVEDTKEPKAHPSTKEKPFKIHNLLKIQERNNTIIFNLQSSLLTEIHKKAGNDTTTSQKSTSTISATDLEESINSLKTDNNVIQQRITTITRNEINLYNSLKKTSQHKRYSLKKRLNSLHSNLQLLLQQLKNRQNLSKHNTAILLHQQTVSAQKIQLEQERIKLQSTNKIHNFTETQLPEEDTNLLNKGTTFIPTQENFNPLKLSRTISSEINSALELIIKRPAQSSYTSKIKSSRNKKRTKPYTKNNPIKLLQEEQLKPNFNFHLIDYVHNTISYTKHYLQSTNLKKLIQSHHTNITPSTTEHILKLQNSTDIIITQIDKTMGWALVPISWFTNEYN